jgi:putative transcriptional regulator
MSDLTDTSKQSDKPMEHSLAGKLLIAMPNMGDARFHKAVIFVCAHDENGAMGLVINQTLPGLGLSELLEKAELFEKMDITKDILSSLKDTPVMSGGPVETERGFILHQSDFHQNDTIVINDEFSVTGTIDALKALALGEGPQDMLFMLGYAGWSAEQLEAEIQQNAWLMCDADKEIVFEGSASQKWEQAIETLGFDPGMLSAQAGNA